MPGTKPATTPCRAWNTLTRYRRGRGRRSLRPLTQLENISIDSWSFDAKQLSEVAARIRPTTPSRPLQGVHADFPDDPRFAQLRSFVERRAASWTLSARPQCVDVKLHGRPIVLCSRWRGWRHRRGWNAGSARKRNNL